MKLMVTVDDHFVRDPSGAIAATYAGVHYAFWRRYLDVFDSVLVAARMRDILTPGDQDQRADGKDVSFLRLRESQGPRGALLALRSNRATIRGAIPTCDAFLLRAPSIAGFIAYRALSAQGIPFGLEVVGDPWDSLGPRTVKSAVRPLARRLVSVLLKRQCRASCAVAYVTREALQRRYPPSPGAFTTHFSSIVLQEEDCLASPRAPGREANHFIFVGSLETWYKGPDILLRSFQILSQERPSSRLVLVGDGRRRPDLESLATALGIRDRVTFAGRLPAGNAVRQRLDEADLFVLPSRQEGLPRSMIEAMARGLPCIGSRVGGIPELLQEEDMAPPEDAPRLARRLAEVSSDPARLAAMSSRNLNRAAEYKEDRLRERRGALYQRLRQVSDAYWRQQGRERT